MRSVIAAGLAVAAFLTTADHPAGAADPTIAVPEGDILWGFDGTVMRDRFNPLTLVVDNPTPEAFDGEVRLHRADFSGQRIGGFLSETIYLAPGTRRIVQFYPLSMSEMENWVLSWEGGQVTLPQPRQGPPARVLLTEEGDLFDRGGAVKRFPTRNFPPYATATDGLAELVIDQAPDWEVPRRQAFLDWLMSGGVVHLIRGPDGRHPQFTGDLAVLNEPSDEFRVGAGRVRRHDVNRAELSGAYVSAQMDPPEVPVEETPEEVARTNEYGVYNFPLEEWRMNTGVFNQLKRMVKAEHNWGVIHLLSLSYIAVLFPGCFLIGREFRHVPATFGAIGGATLLFGGAFYLVGNRGYGESTSVHAVALAEHVDGDKYDVTEWSSVFVTAGGDYAFSHQGEERLYSDATDNEPVGGVETAGSAGRFVVDVPPFSTRVMAHKALVRLPPAAPAVDPSAGSPVFRLPKGFPAELRDAYAVIGTQVLTYRRTGDELQPVGSQATPAKEFFKPKNADFVTDDMAWGEDLAPATRISQLARPLMVYSLRLMKDDDLKKFRVPDGRVRLFVYAPLSPQLQTLAGPAEAEVAEATPEPLSGQTGSVLYSYDLAL